MLRHAVDKKTGAAMPYSQRKKMLNAQVSLKSIYVYSQNGLKHSRMNMLYIEKNIKVILDTYDTAAPVFLSTACGTIPSVEKLLMMKKKTERPGREELGNMLYVEGSLVRQVIAATWRSMSKVLLITKINAWGCFKLFFLVVFILRRPFSIVN